MSLIWRGPWGWYSVLPLSCALAHSFQRLRSRINLLRTSILLNGHIVAHELFHKYYKYWSFQEKCAQRPFVKTGYKKLEKTLGGTHKLTQNICLLRICGYKKKKRHHSLCPSKFDFLGSMWRVSGRVVASNYVKIYVKRLLI